MRKVVITAGDILTPLGDLRDTWDNLLQGQSGVEVQAVENMQGSWPLGIIAGEHGPVGALGRFTNVLDTLLDTLPELDAKGLLICSTTKAAVDQLVYQPESEVWQPWNIGKQLALKTGLASHVTVSGACSSGALAAINGAMRIASGEVDQVLVVAVDLVSEFVLTGFDSLKALSPTIARPFDAKRDGLSLGDGAAWILLEAEEKAENPLAILDAHAVTCDATHITAPCRYGSGLKAALAKINRAGDWKVGGIQAHGTGTVYNDSMELKAFSEIYENAMPICSVKGALGHSLGAAGAVEILLSIKCLQQGVLHPTVGLRQPEESTCSISGQTALPLQANSVLTTNSGFGGINSAILLSQNFS